MPGAHKLLWAGIATGSALLLWGLTMGANLLLGTPVAGAVATLIMSVLWLLYIRRGRLTPGPGRSLVPYLILMIGTITGRSSTSVDLGSSGNHRLASPVVHHPGTGVADLFDHAAR